jgi:hypothetical protein
LTGLIFPRREHGEIVPPALIFVGAGVAGEGGKWA